MRPDTSEDLSLTKLRNNLSESLRNALERNDTLTIAEIHLLLANYSPRTTAFPHFKEVLN